MNQILFPTPAAPDVAASGALASFEAPLQRLGLGEKGERLAARISAAASLSQSLSTLGAGHAKQIGAAANAASKETAAALRDIWSQKRGAAELLQDWNVYATDFAQRAVLFLDIMREVGNKFNEQQPRRSVRRCWPTTTTSSSTGARLPRPVNYLLLEIIPPHGVTVDPKERPYMIIDPRAGHGPGIGGFKTDSEVGVALAHGHRSIS